MDCGMKNLARKGVENMRRTLENKGRRFLALALVLVMALGYLPVGTAAETDSPYTKVADDMTMVRFNDLYGNDTKHAGKVTVDKSVSAGNLDANGDGTPEVTLDDENNFLVTVSQTAQVMALSSQMNVPVDVVFVLDTSESMKTGSRHQSMVNAANSAIRTLMAANSENRVGVVAFSAYSRTNNSAAAEVLSSLAHYSGTAASSHLRLSNSVIYGQNRNASRTVSGGTNIQAGIALGAQMLMNVDENDTYVTDAAGNQITRIPFLIILSDGQPTFSMTSDTWYSNTLNLTGENGSGNQPYPGNGFMAALTAAYYKGKITEHYFDTNASADNRCFVYSLGVQLNSLDSDERDLAELTMDPAQFLNDRSNTYSDDFRSYWSTYSSGRAVTVTVNGRSTNYGNNPYTDTISANTVSETKNYVNGISSAGKQMYSGGITYNDGYYNAANTSDIAGIFDTVMSEISKKAISAPTQVNTTADFDGYVTFTDVIGEYMEVKDMKGLLAGGFFYQGKSFAQYLTDGVTDEFEEELFSVLNTRLALVDKDGTADITGQQLISDALAYGKTYGTQAYYDTATGEYDNSIVWWGHSYDVDDGFEQKVQCLDAAQDDSIAYITSAQKPADANVICRSYFFYGEADGANLNLDHPYLYFVVRVQRELTAPYRQTVVVSAPASLLSMEKVYITEDTTGTNPTYTAKVETPEPARVVYEVGLRSDINEHNVSQIVSADYRDEVPVDGIGNINYDAETGTYYFYTNDWDRQKKADTHERAMSKATFYAADNNAYYTYQENTYLYNANGQILTRLPADGKAYYYRDVYSWSGSPNSEGEYTAAMTPTLIPVVLPEGASITTTGNLRQDSTGIYITAGTYTAAVISPDGNEEVEKDVNKTNTSIAVAHPVRTGDSNDAHYTVYLGNNGVLTLKEEKAKSVDVTKPNADGTYPAAPTITDADGNVVMVGDILTYHVDVINTEDGAATAVVTDKIPTGTALVPGSISDGGQENGGTITWNLSLAKGETKTVSFQVKVTGVTGIANITNTASIKLGNNPAYTTNTTNNPPEGKKAVDTSGNDLTGALQVGDVIVYRIRYYNDTDVVDPATGKLAKATITITDPIPAGTTYVVNSASDGGQLVTENGVTMVKWVLTDVEPGAGGVVSFRVTVDASAKEGIENGASIQINDDPSRETNVTVNEVATGSISVTKTVDSAIDAHDTKSFTIRLTETTGKLNGEFTMTRNGTDEKILFENGVEEVEIQHGQTLVIQGLPMNAAFTVAELFDENGWEKEISKTTVYASSAADASAITNSFEVAPVGFQLKATKNFEGNNFPAGVTFTFNATQVNADGSAYTAGTPIVVSAAVIKGAANKEVINFTTSNFTEAFSAPRYYIVSEKALSLTGLTTSTAQYLLELDVDLDGEALVVKAGYKYRASESESWPAGDFTALNMTQGADGVYIAQPDGDGNYQMSFTNTYAPLSTTLELGGTKELTGRYLKEGDFSFQLVQVTNETTGEGTIIDTTSNVEDGDNDPHTGKFDFLPITYTAADEGKTFTYVIREANSGAPNTTYDNTLYYVSVSVADHDLDGQLDATKTITKWTWNNAEGKYVSDGEVSAAAFKNTHSTPNVPIYLSGKKTLNGAELKAEAFTFQVVEAEVDGSNWTEKENGLVAAAGNDESGNITFSPINFTAAMFDRNGAAVQTRQFHYIVKEVIPGSGEPSFDITMDYDRTIYRITIEATYTVATGELTAKIVSVNGADVNASSYAGLNFTNTKNPDTILFAPEGVKVTEGTNLPDNLRFSFRVTSLDGTKLEGTGISAAATGGEDSIAFTSLEYGYGDIGKTFLYLIEEATTEVEATDGVVYDDAKYVLAVTVGQNSTTGALEIPEQNVKYFLLPDSINVSTITVDNYQTVLTGQEKTNASFKNTFNLEYYLNITATKVLNAENHDLAANAFDFRLQLLEKVTGKKGTYGTTTSVVNGTNAADGKVTFGTLLFTESQLIDSRIFGEPVVTEDLQAKTKTTVTTYQYEALLSEIEPATAKLAGVTYDGSKYIVVFKWVKTVETTDPGTAQESSQTTFTQPEIVGVYVATDMGDGTYNIGADVPGEVKTENGVTDLGVTFTNEYEPTSTTATILAKKTLSGRELKANEFVFQLYRYDTEQKKELLAETATNAADGSVIFSRTYPSTIDAKYFDAENNATFAYHIVEVDTGMGGIEYSGSDYWVEVIIHHDTEKASLNLVSVTYYEAYNKDTGVFSGPITDNNEETIDAVFANAYDTNDATFTPVLTKTLVGAKDTDGDGTLDNTYHFSFEAVETDANGNIQYETAGGKTYAKVVSTGSATVTSANATAISFTPILFTDHNVLTRYFMIRENAGTAEGVTYSDAVIYLKVVMKDDGKGGLTLDSHGYYSDKNFTNPAAEQNFVNGYGPGYTVLNLDIDKQVVIANGNPGDVYDFDASTFDFIVYKDAGNNGIYDAAVDTEVASSGSNADSENGIADISFGSLIYTRDDIYAAGADRRLPATKSFTYFVRENTSHTVPGITMDDAVMTVTVTVTDDGYGNLTAVPAYEKDGKTDNVFVNTYSSTPATADLFATKTLINKTLTAGEFSFELKQDQTVLQTRKNGPAAEGDTTPVNEVRFDRLTFTHPGTYTYTISEVDEGKTGYTYDGSLYTVVIKVTDNYQGKLSAQTTYYKGTETVNDNIVGAATFTNSYTPPALTDLDLDVAIGAKKAVVDGNGNAVKLDDLRGFYFEIVDYQGNSVFKDAEGNPLYGSSNKDGLIIDFPLFTFQTAGAYYYTIREVSTEDVKKPGYTYDTNEWLLYILVRYNADTGLLEVKPEDVKTFPVAASHDSGEQAETTPVFTNVYDPTPAEVTVTAQKNLSGRALKEREFTFRLMNGNIIVAENHNHANGVISFPLKYTAADLMNPDGTMEASKNFAYTVVEVVPAEAVDNVHNGVTYTREVKTVNVTVWDDHGVLKASVNGQTASSVSVGTFTNTYAPADVKVNIYAHKSLVGADLASGAFTFELRDEDGKLVDSRKNDADGIVQFPLTFTDADLNGAEEATFVYTLSEQAGKLAGMTYDADTYEITVTVKDNQNGYLVASVAYSASPIFENIYEGTSALAVISATKTLEGKPLAADTFTFELVDGDDKVVAETTNDASGGIGFAMEYTEAGTYTYTLREKKGTETGMTYDEKTYKVTVTVTADENGYLTAAVSYDTTDGKQPAFRNVFTPAPVAVTLQGTKSMTGRNMKDGEFSFQVHDGAGNLVATGTNTADGKITFTPVTMSVVGKYVLTVTEVNNSLQYVTYDTAKFTVNVEVTNKDGILSASVDYPEEIVFRNSYKVPATTPDTGDATPVALHMSLMILSLLCILAMIIFRPRKKGKYLR